MCFQREQADAHNVFYEVALEVTLCHFHNILLVTQASPSDMGEVYTPHEYQESEITGEHLGVWHHTSFNYSFPNLNGYSIHPVVQTHKRGFIFYYFILYS